MTSGPSRLPRVVKDAEWVLSSEAWEGGPDSKDGSLGDHEVMAEEVRAQSRSELDK